MFIYGDFPTGTATSFQLYHPPKGARTTVREKILLRKIKRKFLPTHHTRVYDIPYTSVFITRRVFSLFLSVMPWPGFFEDDYFLSISVKYSMGINILKLVPIARRACVTSSVYGLFLWEEIFYFRRKNMSREWSHFIFLMALCPWMFGLFQDWRAEGCSVMVQEKCRQLAVYR